MPSKLFLSVHDGDFHDLKILSSALEFSPHEQCEPPWHQNFLI